ncbi:hypothetical protein [Amniculibacterium aquaticum]|uniref:hypothetical protein n=1 Tax=Amniculibacterium aquaticum TaxID=2479858 RepID=UPI000F5AD16B|nr:hypothetical protein [Amniculibacterium aquaticum]
MLAPDSPDSYRDWWSLVRAKFIPNTFGRTTLFELSTYSNVGAFLLGNTKGLNWLLDLSF